MWIAERRLEVLVVVGASSSGSGRRRPSLAEVREQVADLRAALAAGLELPPRLEQRPLARATARRRRRASCRRPANSFGLGSNVSMCDTPPVDEQEDDALRLRPRSAASSARAGRLGRRAVRPPAARETMPGSSERAADQRADHGAAGGVGTCIVTSCRRSPGSIDINELVAQEQRPGEALPRLRRRSSARTPLAAASRAPSPGTPSPPPLLGASAAGRRASRYARSIRAGVVRRSRSSRAANFVAWAWTNGSFIRNSACSGVVLVMRSAVLALVSAPSNSARNGCRWMPLRHQVDAAAVGVVDGHERVVLREVPRRSRAGTGARRRACGRGRR